MRSLVIAMMSIGFTAGAFAQQATSPAVPTNPPAASQPMTKAAARKKPSAAVPSTAVQRIPIESAPPTPANPATAAQTAQQRAADDKVLAQERARSAADAQVTNAIVDQAQKRQDKVQNEVRIQDAPGPAQTGIVPAAGPPVIPAQATPTTANDPVQPQTPPVPPVPPVPPPL